MVEPVCWQWINNYLLLCLVRSILYFWNMVWKRGMNSLHYWNGIKPCLPFQVLFQTQTCCEWHHGKPFLFVLYIYLSCKEFSFSWALLLLVFCTFCLSISLTLFLFFFFFFTSKPGWKQGIWLALCLVVERAWFGVFLCTKFLSVRHATHSDLSPSGSYTLLNMGLEMTCIWKYRNETTFHFLHCTIQWRCCKLLIEWHGFLVSGTFYK